MKNAKHVMFSYNYFIIIMIIYYFISLFISLFSLHKLPFRTAHSV